MSQSNYDIQADMARQLFLRYDQARLIQKYALEANETHIFLSYLGMPLRIRRRDAVVEAFHAGGWQECRDFNTVMTLYDLLCFHQGPEPPTLAQQWCTVGHFIITGVQNTQTFTKKYAARFDGRLTRLAEECRQLGGEILPSLAGADLTCRFPVTPFFPVLLQFWESDEEFPAKLLLLWDRNTDQFLHFETTFYLQGDLLERLRRRMET